MGQAGRFAGVRSLLMIDGPVTEGAFGVSGCADAVILDARLAVDGGAVNAMIARARESLAPMPPLIVRIAAIDTGSLDDDLDVAMAWHPDAILLGDATGGAAIQRLGVKLAVREASLGLPEGGTAILAECAAAGLLSLHTFVQASPRLAALTWDSHALSGQCGGEGGAFEERAARAVPRALLAFAAAAAGVPAFDTAFPAAPAAFERDCRAARRLGYAGKVAVDHMQVAAINAIFAAKV